MSELYVWSLKLASDPLAHFLFFKDTPPLRPSYFFKRFHQLQLDKMGRDHKVY